VSIDWETIVFRKKPMRKWFFWQSCNWAQGYSQSKLWHLVSCWVCYRGMTKVRVHIAQGHPPACTCVCTYMSYAMHALTGHVQTQSCKYALDRMYLARADVGKRHRNRRRTRWRCQQTVTRSLATDLLFTWGISHLQHTLWLH
jgi:hypothetical protein